MSLNDSDYHQEIETRWWHLMDEAHKKGLTIHLHKGKSNYGGRKLVVKIKTNYENPRCVFTDLDLDHSTELFYRAESFVDKFKKD